VVWRFPLCVGLGLGRLLPVFPQVRFVPTHNESCTVSNDLVDTNDFEFIF
jgi:hypothetical protein